MSGNDYKEQQGTVDLIVKKKKYQATMKFLCPIRSGREMDRSGEKEDNDRDIPGMHQMDKMGLYQITMYIIISIPLLLSAGFTVGYVFSAGDVKYRCFVPECEDPLNTTYSTTWSSYSVPFTSCTRYLVHNVSETDVCTESSFTNETERCESWVYDSTERTILNEWDLTCKNNQWKLTLVGTINNIGQFVGLIFTGYLSDRFGRRTVLTFSTFITGVVGLFHSFSVNYWMFLVCEFLVAVAAAGIYSAGFILGVELVGVKQRVFGGTIISCMYAVGEICLGLIAMWLKSWRVILRMVYGPALLAIALPLIIPESIRWLVTKRKGDEIVKIFKRMAWMNRIEISEEAILKFKEMKSEYEKQSLKEPIDKLNLKQVLSRSKILIRLLVCIFCWVTNTFVYYGLSLNSVAVAGDKYLNFILVSAVEIPAYFIAWILIEHVGRKPALFMSFILSGLFCLAIDFVPSGTWTYLPLVLYMGGKGCITMAFGIIYIYTAEMFPTSLRHSLLGICSMTGRIGSILAPQTPLLGSISESLPLILFGSMGLIAGFLSLIFPETLGTKLPDTLYETENIGKDLKKNHKEWSSS
ncbi:solute carrier family 22 member 5 isoform X2 [Cephus cinctus]|uniref:Solute carrier family 22 member 5 isoform X2 n=1 Tax=Cephus cinctus TaxID=211228 RepID=A0AAJ7BQN0_CEPCN|nr:solute carrier family 22 member 5 isoform X2 [Cephus cinctus]